MGNSRDLGLRRGYQRWEGFIEGAQWRIGALLGLGKDDESWRDETVGLSEGISISKTLLSRTIRIPCPN